MPRSPQPLENHRASGRPKLSLPRKIAFLGAGLLGLLMLGEILLRVLGYQARVTYPPAPHRDLAGDRSVKTANPDIPYLRLPGSSFTEHWPDDPRGYFDETKGILYRVNNAGFRGPDFTKERSDAVRIIFLGDSFCWGVGVKEEDHFVQRTARKLAQSPPFDGRFELFNFGLEGYNTRQEVALFKEVVLDYRPDVAVIWYFLNDWELERGVAGTKRYLRGNRLLRRPRRYSRLLDLIVTPIDLRLATGRMIELYRNGYQKDSLGWRAARVALEEFADLCHRRGIIPVLAIHPVLIRLDGAYPFADLHRKVFDFATRAGLRTVDLLPVFAGRDAEDLWVHPVDQHPNEVAHRLAAERFFSFLLPVLRENESALRRRLEP